MKVLVACEFSGVVREAFKNLPLLQPTDVLEPPALQANGKPRWNNQTPTGQNKLGPSPTRGLERSRTYKGIATAFAAQWGV